MDFIIIVIKGGWCKWIGQLSRTTGAYGDLSYPFRRIFGDEELIFHSIFPVAWPFLYFSINISVARRGAVPRVNMLPELPTRGTWLLLVSWRPVFIVVSVNHASLARKAFVPASTTFCGSPPYAGATQWQGTAERWNKHEEGMFTFPTKFDTITQRGGNGISIW